MNIGVILAGGVGSRLGAKNKNGENIPKQFVEVLGKPVLAYTVEAFQNHLLIDAIEVVCVPSYIEYMKEMKEKYGLSKIKWVAPGGSTFQESVMNGVNYLEEKVSGDDTLIIHFGASPFVTDDIITDCLRVTKEHGTAISTTDFLLLSGKKNKLTSVSDSENYSDIYIDRNTVAVMNSPHGFQYKYVSDLYKEAVSTGIIDTVEPHTTTLMYTMGRRLYFSKGSQINIKITRKEDLDLFEGYILMRQKKNRRNE